MEHISRQILDSINVGIDSDAVRLKGKNYATTEAEVRIMTNGGNNDLYTVTQDTAGKLFQVAAARDTQTELPVLAEIAGTEAFQFAAAHLILTIPDLKNDMLREYPDDYDDLILLYNNVLADFEEHAQKFGRREPRVQQRHQGYGQRPQRTGYSSQQRHQARPAPRNNGVSSHQHQARPSNSRFGAPATSTGANIGTTGGGMSQLQRVRALREGAQQQQQQQPDPRVNNQRYGNVENVINITRQPDLSEPTPAPAADEVNSVIQTERYRPTYRPTDGRVAPTLYDKRKHIPLYVIRNRKVTDEVILSKDSNEGKQILELVAQNKMEKHNEFLYVPRKGLDKETPNDCDGRVRDTLVKLAGDQVPFEEIESQLLKENNTITAKPDAKLPEAFSKKNVEVVEVQVGPYSSPTDRLFRLVDHVNGHLAALNPDQNYDNLVITGIVRDILPFAVSHPEDIETLNKLASYLSTRKNIPTCVSTMRRLESLLPAREWNVINDLMTEVTNEVGLVDFALDGPITNFTDEVQMYVSLCDQHYGRQNSELFAARIVEKFVAALQMEDSEVGKTFSQLHQIIILPIDSNDLNLASTTPNLNVGLVSKAAMPELYAGLERQLNLCGSNILTLTMYTRDGTAIEIRRTPIGDAILLVTN